MYIAIACIALSSCYFFFLCCCSFCSSTVLAVYNSYAPPFIQSKKIVSHLVVSLPQNSKQHVSVICKKHKIWQGRYWMISYQLQVNSRITGKKVFKRIKEYGMASFRMVFGNFERNVVGWLFMFNNGW